MSKTKDYKVTVHVEPNCSPATLRALGEMCKVLIEHIEQRGLTPHEADTEHTCPDCKGKGIVKDGFGVLYECVRCHGSGQV